LWAKGHAPTELTLLAGHATGQAGAINARGDVVGYSATASGARRAILWPNGGLPVDLGALPGGDFSQAFGANASGDIVGTSNSRAVLWPRNGGGIRDLNSLIPPSTFMLTKAVGINNNGNIIATGHDVPAGHGAEHSHEDEHDLPVRVFLLVRSASGQ
jgi:probable HAF family extracellular repeat protein